MKSSTLLVVRIVAILLILLMGYGAMQTLSHLAKKPELKPPQEITVRAQGVIVQSAPIQTSLSGYGTARALSEVEISPEVGGRIIKIHPLMKAGNVIGEGELLFQIDPENYQLVVNQLEGDLAAIKAQLDHNRQMEANDKRRLKVSQEILDLSKKEYERIRKLTEIDGVESRSRLESQKQELKTREDQVLALENNLQLYPSLIQQLTAQLTSTQARLDKARLDLARTEVRAPFTGRVVSESIEKDQMVVANTRLVTLADDSELEIIVPLEGEEALRWLDVTRGDNDRNWFAPPTDNTVRIRWVERPGDLYWTGHIARIEAFNSDTRSVDLAIRVGRESDNGAGNPNDLPLVDGMFCKVEIPGRIIPEAFQLPRNAVSEDATVLTVVESRIQTRPVKVARYEEQWAYITDGLEDGDEVLTTRPAVELDGTKVLVTLPDEMMETNSNAVPSGATEISRPKATTANLETQP